MEARMVTFFFEKNGFYWMATATCGEHVLQKAGGDKMKPATGWFPLPALFFVGLEGNPISSI